MTNSPLQVLVVDDSALARQLIVGVLEAGGMRVQSAADPLIAQTRLRTWRPDVIVLDLEMPKMDGLTFMRVLARDHDIPVVICSGVAGERTVVAMRALAEGAVEIVARPRIGLQQFFRESHVLLNDAVTAAAQARPRRRRPPPPPRRGPPPIPPPPQLSDYREDADGTVIALGASTGGTEALHHVLAAFPTYAPATVVVQHMPEGFTAAFAAWLDSVCRVHVREAATGDRLRPGVVLIAPGGRHLEVRRGTDGLVAVVADGPLVSRHRPSVDVLFRSVAQTCGHRAVAGLLTGMGDDGRDGMLALRAAGAITLAQDEATSVVFGMPKSAIDAGAVEDVFALPELAAALLSPRRRPVRRSSSV